MRYFLAAASCLLCAGPAWALLPNTNREVAELREAADAREGEYRYQIILSGMRRPIAHDPVSALARSRQEVAIEIFTHSVSGRIDADSLAVRGKDAARSTPALEGFIELTGERLRVRLRHVSPFACDRPMTFNGDYVLVRRQVASIPAVSAQQVSSRAVDPRESPQCIAQAVKASLAKSTAKEACECRGLVRDPASGSCVTFRKDLQCR